MSKEFKTQAEICDLKSRVAVLETAQIDQLGRTNTLMFMHNNQCGHDLALMGEDKSVSGNVHRNEKGEIQVFYGEAPALADGTYKNSIEETERAGFETFVVKDGKVINVEVSKMQEPYTSSPTLASASLGYASDGSGKIEDPSHAHSIKEPGQYLGRGEWAAADLSHWQKAYDKVLEELNMHVKETEHRKLIVEGTFKLIRTALHCPDGKSLPLYVETEVAPFIDAICQVMQENEYTGPTKYMPEQIRVWLAQFVKITNELTALKSKVEEESYRVPQVYSVEGEQKHGYTVVAKRTLPDGTISVQVVRPYWG